MDVFELRDRLIGDYSDCTLSFVHDRDSRIRQTVEEAIDAGAYWPEPLNRLTTYRTKASMLQSCGTMGVGDQEALP